MQAFRPDYAALSSELISKDSSLLVAKVDADENRELGEHFHIEALPTVKWFEGAEEIATYNGHFNKKDVLEWVEKVKKGFSKQLRTADEVLKRSGVSVVAVFNPGTNENDDEIRSAYRKRKLYIQYLLII